MRATRTVQPSVPSARDCPSGRQVWSALRHGSSARHDRHLRAGLHLLRSPWPDLRDHSALCGAHAMGYSYRGLEFALLDSACVQRFAVCRRSRRCRAPSARSTPTASDQRRLLQDAKQQGIESGTQARIDSTVTETDILKPSDSRLCRYDGVRVLTRLLREARERLEAVSFRDHCRAAKRREQEIRSARGEQRRAATYQRLLSLVAHTIAYAEAAVGTVGRELVYRGWHLPGPAHARWADRAACV